MPLSLWQFVTAALETNIGMWERLDWTWRVYASSNGENKSPGFAGSPSLLGGVENMFA